MKGEKIMPAEHPSPTNYIQGLAQSCKKIIDLDLKDQDHSIDLDLFRDLDPY